MNDHSERPLNDHREHLSETHEAPQTPERLERSHESDADHDAAPAPDPHAEAGPTEHLAPDAPSAPSPTINAAMAAEPAAPADASSTAALLEGSASAPADPGPAHTDAPAAPAHRDAHADEETPEEHARQQRLRATQRIQAVRHELQRVLIGQDAVIDDVLTALLAGGHVLIEGVPGLGKTLLVRALARCFAGDFARIQFTPDLMPSDITGHAVYDRQSEQFNLRKGPIFTHLLLADEINRAPAKTQAALLEAMQERQVTLEGTALPIAQPFMVLATQNPIEQEGTYPLPEAELDRFMLKLRLGYPDADQELDMVRQVTRSTRADMLDVQPVRQVLLAKDVAILQRITSELAIDDQVLDYAVRLARATRTWPGLILGAGPRASIALVRGARARALMRGGAFVLPDDVKHCALAVLRHRVRLSAELDIDGIEIDQVLRQLLDQVPAPRT